MSEKPASVFGAACAQLGRALAAEGFVFRKSHPKLVRKLGDFTEELRFRTSWHNESGELVQLWVDVVVSSARMAAWRKRHPAAVEAGFVGGTALGNLLPPRTDWNLAVRARREEVVAEAEAAIRCRGLPYLALLREVSALERHLLKKDLRGMSPDQLVDVLACFNGVESAARYARAVVARHPDMAVRIRQGMKSARRTRRPPNDASNVYDAFAARLAQLEVPLGPR